MKKITLLTVLFMFVFGAHAQENNCSKEVLEGGDNAWGEFDYYIYASDFLVEQNENFTLTSLTFNAIITPEIMVDGVTLYFYEDTGSGPGTEIGMQEISAVEMISLGAYANFDRYTIDLDLNNPVEFQGNENATTTYWVGITLNLNETGVASFIEVTEDFDTDNATYFYDSQSDTWTDGANPLWPGGGFEHGMVSLYGECSVLGLEDFNQNSLTHFTQNNQLFLESKNHIQDVIVFNSIGQQVMTKGVNANSASINLASLSAGVYLTKINIEGKIKTLRVIVK